MLRRLTVPTISARIAPAAAILALAAVSPALADTPLTPFAVGLGGQIPLADSGRAAGGDLLTDFSASYDFGPRIVIPIRAALDADVQHGTRDGGLLATYGLGASVRLTTPLYAGVGIGIYDVASRVSSPGLTTTRGGGAIATQYFAGEQLFAVPGAAFSLQATVRIFPTVAGVNATSAGLGLRVKL